MNGYIAINVRDTDALNCDSGNAKGGITRM
jgi:hypothetical protein